MTNQHPTRGAQLVREFTAPVRAAQDDAGDATGREFTGIAVPWNDPVDLYDFREEFAPGSVEPTPNVLVCYRHDEPVGRVVAYRDSDTGWEVDGRLSDTTVARDAATLVRDGVIDRLSIRFIPLEWKTRTDDDGVEHITYTRATVSEVSLVPFPAYTNAAITGIRQQDPKEIATMPTNTHDDDAELRSAVDELTRKVELIGTPAQATEAHPLAQFRSFGEYVKAVARGDEAALRAYSGLTLGDITPSAPTAPEWAAGVVRLIDANTPTLKLLNHTKDLPATGNSVEHGVITLNNGLRVAEQLKEGDDLVFGKLGLSYGQAARVRTIGGWTDMSRQVIERSPINVVDLMWRGFAIKYAEALEAIAAKALTDLYAAQVAAGGTNTITGDLTTANGIIDLLVDLAVRYEASPYKLDAIYVAPDLFKAMAKIDQTPKALQITAAPDNKLGTLSVASVEAHLSNVLVKPWAGAQPGTAFAVDGQAVKVQESPGAPFRLQDENIVNLTKQFSVYGYVSAYSEMPEALVPIVKAA